MRKGSGVYPDAAGDPELSTFGNDGAGRERRWRREGGGKEIPSIADLGEKGRWLVGLDGEDAFESSPLVAWSSIFFVDILLCNERKLESSIEKSEYRIWYIDSEDNGFAVWT